MESRKRWSGILSDQLLSLITVSEYIYCLNVMKKGGKVLFKEV